VKPFNIAILGYNSKLSVEGLNQIIENNREQLSRVSSFRQRVMLKDNTTLEAIVRVDYNALEGKNIDQLILFDDNRWEIEWSRSRDIELIQAMAMQRSIVPEEFQILKYEDIRGEY